MFFTNRIWNSKTFDMLMALVSARMAEIFKDLNSRKKKFTGSYPSHLFTFKNGKLTALPDILTNKYTSSIEKCQK